MPGGSRFDFSIRGDELEQHRIQLEHNLQHTDLSLHLSSTPEDYSLEYPRHNSAPSAPFSVFHSMDPSRDEFDADDRYSHLHAWSYRTAEDEDGVNPYGGETMSTAAHHASALTLSAGLGGRGARRDISLSGAEYDPDRPLHDLVANIDSKFSLFDADRTRSRNFPSNPTPFDPVVVDNTAELDRLFEPQDSRATPTRMHPSRSPNSSASSTSELDTPDHSTSARPKLSDALTHLAFSPKRPRSPAARSPSPAFAPLRRHVKAAYSSHMAEGEPTPRAKKTHRPQSHQTHHPEVTIRPPTPSTGNSKFTKLARGLARDIEAEQSRWDVYQDAMQSELDFVPGPGVHSTFKPNRMSDQSLFPKRGTNNSVYLPDVTGLTSAIETPSKARIRHYPYKDDHDEYGDGKARLIATLALVQQKLAHLDSENTTSRHRMLELERELDGCKQEVVRERERVLQREDIIKRQQMQRSDTAARGTKGKGRAEEDVAEVQKRYKQAVEEKKALEALIQTLRSHMTRLTTELASHQRLLDELRTLREADSHTLQEKVGNVDRLRTEVEKVAGEIEVLKGVVEEGLRERRSRQDRGRIEVTEPEEIRQPGTRLYADRPDSDIETEDEREGQAPEYHGESMLESRDPSYSPPPSPPSRPVEIGQTGRRHYVDPNELERISVEMEERRSERSYSRMSGSHSHSSAQSQSSQHSAPPGRTSPRLGSERSVSWNGSHIDQEQHSRPTSPALSHSSQRLRRHCSSPSQIQGHTRPTAPTPSHATGKSRKKPAGDFSSVPPRRSARSGQGQDATTPEAAPFPQIRGTRLERMFFSAPEHNVKTCRTCRRRRAQSTGDNLGEALWSHTKRRKGAKTRVKVSEDSDAEKDDEGFEDGEEVETAGERRSGARGKAADTYPYNLDFLAKGTPKDRVPPQTVLMKVLRELEDDFTHYKGIYTELADQYKLMDPTSNVVKRNVLADHLREVIDILEQKGDHIASLSDLLTFSDKPLGESALRDKN